MINNAFSIASLFINIPLVFIYFSKKRINTLENKLYSYIVIASFLESIFAILAYITIINREKIPIINEICSKLLVFVMFLWMVLLAIYIFTVACFKEDINDKIKRLLYVFIIISCLIVGFLVFSKPLYYYSMPLIAYSYGPSANVVYFSVTLYGVFCVLAVIINFKHLFV